jgi:hypothetical protein
VTALVVVLLLFVSPVFAQSLGYADADNPSQAVGMMKSTLIAANKMRTECASRFPELDGAMAKNFETWTTNERVVISKTESYWNRMLMREPKLAEYAAYVETAVMRNLETVASMPGGSGNTVVRQLCARHFEELASGVWRARTPRAYKFLDDAPSPE